MPTALSTRRLAAVSAALFLIILAFLAGRVHAGADPTQATTPASNVTPAETAPAPAETDGSGTDPYGAPSGDPGFAPDQGGAVPDQGGGAVPDQGGAQDADPPATFAS